MKRLIFAILMLPTILTACSNNHNPVQETSMQAEASVQPAADMKAAEATNDKPSPTPVSSAIMEKSIIKTANLTMEVKSNEAYNGFLRGIIQKHGAYIAKEDKSTEDDKEEASLIIKVPVQQFDDLVNGLATQDAKLLQRSIASEDVTSSIIDTKARLDTRKATRDKYLEFLQKATKIEDVLKVQQEINNIQEDIESADARLAQLSGEAKYSTIHLTYFEPGQGNSYHNGTEGIGSRMASALKNGGRIFIDFFIVILTIWPVWLGLLLVVFIIKKLRRKNSVFVKKNI